MHFLDHWLLTILLMAPLAGAAAVLTVSRSVTAWRVALTTSLITLVLALLILVPFRWMHDGETVGSDRAGPTVQMRQQVRLASTHSSYEVAIDGLSFPFIVLTTVLCTLACAASFCVTNRAAVYLATMLMLESSVLGTFLAFDLLMWWGCMFSSVMLAGVMIAAWGGPGRRRAATTFLGYTLPALACILFSVIGIHAIGRLTFSGGTFDWAELASASMRRVLHSPEMLSHQAALFALILIGLLGLLASFPFHFWLPAVVVETPPQVAVLVACLIPAAGGYGLFRMALALFPDASIFLWPIVPAVSMIGIVWVALCAIAQTETRRSIAYIVTSVTGFVVLGASMRTSTSANGAVFLLLGLQLVTSLALLPAGAAIDVNRRMSSASPQYGAFFAIAWLGWLVVPIFLGEIIVLLGAFQAIRPDSALRQSGLAQPGHVYAICAAACVGMLLSGAAVVATARRQLTETQPGAATGESGISEANRREMAVYMTLAIIALLPSIFPMPLCFAFTRRALAGILHLTQPTP